MQAIQTYLNDGWFITEAATVLAHGVNNESGGYILTLADPSGHFIRQTFVPRSRDVEELLRRERVPMAA
ncbi:MAG: hypothetical protein N2117_08985 [Anaerolineales bacterium]|nr:hypothetical protein [Anaerolineales bacterium]MCX7755366.1 hypothetical protein [Anaerolineales bacterium]MDW8279105.1 hypothetical protein [Anaerolineales bacterium]